MKRGRPPCLFALLVLALLGRGCSDEAPLRLDLAAGIEVGAVEVGAPDVQGGNPDRAAEARAEASSAPGGALLFQSGFEPGTTVSGVDIKGIDASAPKGVNGNWDKVATGLDWVTDFNAYLEGASMSIAADPLDATNKVLHFHNHTVVDGLSRSQWTLKQVDPWDADNGLPNKFVKQFYRCRILIPEKTKTLFTTAEVPPWYMIWESHSWYLEDTRHAVYVRKRAGTDQWYFHVTQQHPNGEQNTTWDNKAAGQDVPVPFGQWFTFEVFFKYGVTDGEFCAAITPKGGARKIVGRLQGKTKFQTKLHDQMVFKMYQGAAFVERMKKLGLDGTHQYYDDFEIWSDYPPGYW